VLPDCIEDTDMRLLGRPDPPLSETARLGERADLSRAGLVDADWSLTD